MTAALPARYLAARKALAELSRIDEVKKFRDKALALEVYAYQAKDAQLARDSISIRKRATRRIGELIDTQRKARTLAKGTLRRGVSKPPREIYRRWPPKASTRLWRNRLVNLPPCPNAILRMTW